MQTPPARLYVLFARDAQIGLILRRGPTKEVASILWNRITDEFTLGQWMRGRIYERCADISPDGKHFIYFTFNGHRRTLPTDESWTAVSRVPYLKALALYPHGDTYNGGGLWTSNNTYWVNFIGNAAGERPALYEAQEVLRDKDHHAISESFDALFLPLLRQGWCVTARDGYKKYCFEKPVGYGWLLKKCVHTMGEGKGQYWEEHVLANPLTSTLINYPDWEWADLDGKRLVWAAKGKLHCARLTKHGLADQRELADFNNWKFRRILAPY